MSQSDGVHGSDGSGSAASTVPEAVPKASTVPGRQRSVVTNFLYSSLSSIVNAFVPLMTYPYIARVLGPENMGKLGVVVSLSGFFLVFATLGLPVYGVRAVARCRHDRLALGRVMSELYFLQACAGVIATGLFAILVVSVPKYRAEPLLFAAHGAMILVSGFNLDWFLQGVEEFRYIGLRNVAMKVLFVILVFVVVRTRGDYFKYSMLFAVIFAATIVLNLRAALMHAGPVFSGFKPLAHIGTLAVFTFAAVAANAYTNLDFLFLGLVSDNRQSGLYNISIRLVRTLGFVTATLSGVLLPRLSKLAGRDERAYRTMLTDSLRAILLFSLPAAAGLFVTADDLIRIFAGQEFRAAAASLRIAAAIVPIVAAANFLQVQVLVPQGKEKKTLLSYAAGLVVGIVSLAVLVPRFGQVGAAAGMLAAEVSVLLVLVFLTGREELRAMARARHLVPYALGALICGGSAALPLAFLPSGGLRLLVSMILGVASYSGFLVIAKDDLVLRLLGRLFGRGRKTAVKGGAA